MAPISLMSVLINQNRQVIMSKCLAYCHAFVSILHRLLMLGMFSFARVVFCMLLLGMCISGGIVWFLKSRNLGFMGHISRLLCFCFAIQD